MNKKIIFKTDSDNDNIPVLSLSMRSGEPGLNTGDDGCNETLSISCYIECQLVGVISPGDTVYTSILGLFDGNNKYFNLVLDSWSNLNGSRVCQISPTGEILGIYSICTI